MIHHSKGKTIKFYELNAKFGNYELSHMKWVLDWGSLLFMMTKYFIFSIKLISLFFTARGRMEFSYRIWSLLTLVITHKHFSITPVFIPQLTKYYVWGKMGLL